jgi:hypothetical protein
MAEGISAAKRLNRICKAVGDYICPECGTKVVCGDHPEAECRHIKWVKDFLEGCGHKIEAC